MPQRDAAEVVDHFVAVVLTHIDREYPNKLDHVMNDAAEVKGPRELHPIFFGSFDWHSSVHGHWLLARALRLYPGLSQRAEVVRLLDGRFTEENVRAEVEYLKRPRRETFERTYGWGWILKLGAEIGEGSRRGAQGAERPRGEGQVGAVFERWDRVLAPLMEAFAERLVGFLPKATYPVRVGTHQNTAFALRLAMDCARVTGRGTMESAIKRRRGRGI